jgi:uncharacterized membrane protein YeaQ/YmgE (transglycosylase-associated protein family)
MNFIIWIVIGGLIGWAASIVMKTDAQQGVILNVVVGIVGALVGGWLLSPLFGMRSGRMKVPAQNFSTTEGSKFCKIKRRRCRFIANLR